MADAACLWGHTGPMCVVSVSSIQGACSLVGAGAGLGWLVLIYLEKNTVDWLIWTG